jgi:PhnB protein
MPTATKLASTASYIREGFRAVTPYIMHPDAAQVIEFLKQTFGAEELFHGATSPTSFHAEVRIGDSMLMIGGGEAVRQDPRRGAFHVYVPDCDAVYQRALEAGAKSLGAPADAHYGERAGYVEDVAGNYWFIATRLGTVELAPGRATVTPFLNPASVAAYTDFLQRAFGAESLAHFENSGRVVYAAVRIDDSVLEMGEVAGQKEPMHFPTAFFLYVPDADASYHRAIEAGATSLWEPADQRYGVRNAGVLDPFGNQWFPSTPLAAAR